MAEDQHPQGTAPRADIEHQIARLQERLAQVVADATQAIHDIAYTAIAIEDRFPEHRAQALEGELLTERIYDPQGYAEIAERTQGTIDRLWARHALETGGTVPLSVAEQLDAFREVLTARRQEMAQENGMETPRPHQHERDTGYGY